VPRRCDTCPAGLRLSPSPASLSDAPLRAIGPSLGHGREFAGEPERRVDGEPTSFARGRRRTDPCAQASRALSSGEGKGGGLVMRTSRGSGRAPRSSPQANLAWLPAICLDVATPLGSRATRARALRAPVRGPPRCGPGPMGATARRS
jgi:hypothetical protein